MNDHLPVSWGRDKFIVEQMVVWLLVVFGILGAVLAMEWVANCGLCG